VLRPLEIQHYSFILALSAAHPDLHSFPTRRSSDLRGKRWPVWCATMRICPRWWPSCATKYVSTWPTSSARLRQTYPFDGGTLPPDRKSTRLNSSHDQISYAVFCLKKKNTKCQSTST